MTAIVASPPQLPTTDGIYVRFPPWPTPPPGVTIVPFIEYAKREVGIKLTCPNPDGIEVDGLDIPTVALHHPHATDKCKTDAVREEEEPEGPIAKKRKLKSNVLNGDSKREWWQIWADEEAGKFTGSYNPRTPAIDRLCQAATDFRMSRAWPPGEPRQLSPTNLFNQFGVFIGLQAIIPTWIRAERRKAEEALKGFKDMVEKSGQNGTQDDNEDDDELSDEGEHLGPPSAAPVGLQNGTHDDETAVDPRTEEDEAEAAAIQEENERKDDRLLAFLNDPETVVKMFLSSYMRKEGLVWADSNLSITPRLLFFFLRYILRNKLLPEYEAGLKKALAVVECAQIELPRTSVVAKIIPCEVSLAFRDQYGSKAAQFKPIIDDTKDEEQETGKLSNGNLDLDDLDDGQWDGDDNVDDTNDENDPALEESAVEYVGDGEYIDAEQPIDEEGISQIEEVDETEPIDDGKANNGYNGWNDNGWGGVPMDVDSGGVWDSQGWNDASKFQFDDTPAIDWTSPVYSLKNFLGIDALPEPYTTGVVEDSIRKIVSVHGPTGATTVGALEAEFESRLGRIVLAPWNDWDVPQDAKGLDEIRRVYSEIYHGRRIEKGIRRFNVKNAEEDEEDIKTLNPEELYEEEDGREYSESSNARIVWESSKGWVVDPDSTDGDLLYSNCTPEKPAPTELGIKNVHDPSKDTIEILVDPGVIDNLKDVVGLGFGGTFVQLVKNPNETTKYWYSDKLALVIPSFYTA